MLRTIITTIALALCIPTAVIAQPVPWQTPRAEAEALREKVVPKAELDALSVLMNDVGQALNNPANRENNFANHRKAYPIYTKLTTAFAYASVGRQDRNRKFFNKYAVKVRAYHTQACAILVGCKQQQ
ncbi:hypothetical protein [Sphingobium sp. BS19]|uniref:hypothetical protein n=1 Tax=Sphingobium sp. BS19 TaxID=3018973 RepID=UPI0022EEF370|nr:hypothetical protein [Sphingobium sp. BS19]GLI99127.1 hypothetical protein Sbs19_29450 [Sphingobium sp. BS19]